MGTAALVAVLQPARAAGIVEHQLTVAAAPSMLATDAEVDNIIAGMNQTMASKSFPFDTPCPQVRFRRAGNVIVDDRLLDIGTFDALEKNMHAVAPAANVLMVTGIDCSGITAAGCGNVGSEPLVVGIANGFETQLWLHERGHNVGLQHSAEPPTVDTAVAPSIGMRFMFWQLGIGHVGKTADECHHFEATTLASAVHVSDGAAPAPTSATVMTPSPPPIPSPPVTPVGGTVFAGDPGPGGAGATPPTDASKAIADAAHKAGLTEAAFRVVGPPWVDGAPIAAIRALTPDDLKSIRGLFEQTPNQFWPQAIQVIALVGTADDAKLLQHALDVPMPAVAPGQNGGNVAQFRTLLQTKLIAPRALGILANRTNSDAAVRTLTQTADLAQARKLVGPATAESLSKRAIDGLAIANSTASTDFVNATTGASLTAVARGPSLGPISPDTHVATLSPDDLERVRRTHEQVRTGGVEAILK